MGLRIGTNVQSLSAQRYLEKNTNAQKDTLEHLSSGSRINKASDDAAGLAISEKMRGQIRSIRQDVRNANDGISMVQTAEGGMNEISSILIRFRELAIQASSDTLGDTERSFINKEVEQLKKEVTRIASTTEFNGKKLLNGSGDGLEIQIGVNNNPDEDRFVYSPQNSDVALEALGLGDISVATKEEARSHLGAIDNAMNVLVANRAELGALQNRMVSAINNLGVYDENLSAARSRISDADMAVQSSELAKNNIQAQANVAVLSQANQLGGLALKLIG